MIPDDEEGEFGLQIAPILDLLFVLLLFFMVSVGSRAHEGDMHVNLAAKSAPNSADQAIPPVILKIDQNGQIYWNDNPISTAKSRDLPELRARMAQLVDQYGSHQSFIIIPDRSTRHERLIDVLSAASGAHVQNLSLGSVSP